VKRFLARFDWVAIMSGIILAAAMWFPWWSLQIQFIGLTYVYPYIIRGPATTLLGYEKTNQMPLMTGLLVGSIVLCFVGSLLRKWMGRIVLGAGSVMVFLAIWRFYVRAGSVASRYRVAVQGEAIATYGGFSPVHVSTRLERGFFLALVAAALCLLAAILHDRLQVRSS
jgi:hypothetical protein